jgi:hypothetical protein
MRFPAIFIFILTTLKLFARDPQNDLFWRITDRNSILWDLTNGLQADHSDNIEMSGLNVAAIISYDVDTLRNLTITRDIIYPQLRTFNKSNEPDWKMFRAYLRRTYGKEIQPNISDNNKVIIFEKVDSVEIAGKLIFYHTPVQGLLLTRT